MLFHEIHGLSERKLSRMVDKCTRDTDFAPENSWKNHGNHGVFHDRRSCQII